MSSKRWSVLLSEEGGGVKLVKPQDVFTVTLFIVYFNSPDPRFWPKMSMPDLFKQNVIFVLCDVVLFLIYIKFRSFHFAFDWETHFISIFQVIQVIFNFSGHTGAQSFEIDYGLLRVPQLLAWVDPRVTKLVTRRSAQLWSRESLTAVTMLKKGWRCFVS